MEIQCREQNIICLNFRKPLWASSSEAEREKRRQLFKGKKETIGDWRVRERRERERKWSRAQRGLVPGACDDERRCNGIQNSFTLLADFC